MESHIAQIRDILDGVAADGNGWSDAQWTHEVKSRIAAYGKELGFEVWAAQARDTYGGEWLYDMTWLKYDDTRANLLEVGLALECEWDPKQVIDDFQKLLLVRADLRIMIFQARTGEKC